MEWWWFVTWRKLCARALAPLEDTPRARRARTLPAELRERDSESIGKGEADG